MQIALQFCTGISVFLFFKRFFFLRHMFSCIVYAVNQSLARWILYHADDVFVAKKTQV
jgi:hypothetical protein